MPINTADRHDAAEAGRLCSWPVTAKSTRTGGYARRPSGSAWSSRHLAEQFSWLPAVTGCSRNDSPIAAAADLPVAAVAARLNDPQVERDNHGRVLGFGLTLVPTGHRIDLADRGHALYGWCGPDVLAIPWLLGTPGRITSRCPATGTPVTAHVGPEGVGEVDPADAVVSFMPTVDPTDIRGSTCDRQHFFASRDAAADWLAQHEHGAVVPVAAAFHATTRAFERAGWTHPRADAGVGEAR